LKTPLTVSPFPTARKAGLALAAVLLFWINANGEAKPPAMLPETLSAAAPLPVEIATLWSKVFAPAKLWFRLSRATLVESRVSATVPGERLPALSEVKFEPLP